MSKFSENAADMIRKVHELAAFREDYIRRKGLSLSFKHTCYKVGISPRMVKMYAPELFENWGDVDKSIEVPHLPKRVKE